MERIIHELTQGSDAWHQFRLEHHGASEAAAMLGLSKNATRSDLLRAKHTGIAKEFSAFVQERIIDRGHEVEALARPIVEELIEDELYPATYSYGKLSASCDGLTMDGTIAFEHKQWAKELAAAVGSGELPREHWPQCQQVMYVTGAERLFFVVSDGTKDNFVHIIVHPDQVAVQHLLVGWDQFDRDLAAYQPIEVIPAAVAAPTLALPAVSIKVEGAVALISNLEVFGAGLKAFIARLPEKPSTDQEFADCKAACKTLQEAQDALDAAEAHAMGQVASFDEMKRTKALYWDLARTTRLAVEKLVVAREQQIRVEIVQKAKAIYEEHVASLTKETGGPWIVLSPPDFAGAVKGKRTIASIQDAVDTALAGGKITADASAKRIREALACIKADGDGYEFLFSDRLALISKPIDDLQLLIKSRISEHKAKEEKREAEQRERIRIEELNRIEAERVAAQKKSAAPALDSASYAFQRGTEGSAPAAADPVQQPAKPAVTLVKGFVRPADQTIIDVLANHYRVPDATVISWLKEMAIFRREVA